MTDLNATPLLAPKGIGRFKPGEYRAYIRSLYLEPPKKEVRPVIFSRTKKGNLGVRINKGERATKWVTEEELRTAAKELGFTIQSVWIQTKKKKIEIRKEVK